MTAIRDKDSEVWEVVRIPLKYLKCSSAEEWAVWVEWVEWAEWAEGAEWAAAKDLSLDLDDSVSLFL
jgi:hypothetical protein